MVRKILLVTMLCSLALLASALVLCTPKSGESALRARTVCKANERSIEPATLGLQALSCPPDAVEVGQLGVDKYGISVGEITDSATIKKIRHGQVLSAADLAGRATP